MTNSSKRIITGLVGIPIVILFMYLGGIYFSSLILLVALLAQIELYRLFEATNVYPNKIGGLLLGSIIILRSWISFDVQAILVVGLMILFVLELFRTKENQLVHVSSTVFGLFYPTLLTSYLIVLREGVNLPFSDIESFNILVSIFLLISITDSSAYFAGKSLGKRPLFSRISPKKTIEGSIGGLIGAGVGGVLLYVFLVPFLEIIQIAGIILICGAISPFGDLIESMFKRSVGVKDSGKVLPGHGGMLDRIDALIYATPLVYYLLIYTC